jgi:hypothetical protein
MGRMPDLTLNEFKELKAEDISGRLQEEMNKMDLPPIKKCFKLKKSPLSCALSSLIRPLRRILPPSLLP